MHQVLYAFYFWMFEICQIKKKLKWQKHKNLTLLPLSTDPQSFQGTQNLTIPLFLSERCGWLLTGLGSPCVAHRVWAIPRCTSNSISKSISCCSKGDKMKNFNIKSCCTSNVIKLYLNIIITVLLTWNIQLFKL